MLNDGPYLQTIQLIKLLRWAKLRVASQTAPANRGEAGEDVMFRNQGSKELEPTTTRHHFSTQAQIQILVLTFLSTFTNLDVLDALCYPYQ